MAIRGTQGRDLTIPCRAPPHLDNPLLQWNFSNGEDPSQILSYHMQSGRSTSSPVWNNHVELDGYRVQIGDGSLRLMDPRHSEHTGGYTCVFSTPYNTHTEHTDVTIDDPAGESANTVTRDGSRCRSSWFCLLWVGPGPRSDVLVTCFGVHLCVCVQLSQVLQTRLLIGGLPVRWSRCWFWFWDWSVSWPTGRKKVTMTPFMTHHSMCSHTQENQSEPADAFWEM